LTFATGTNCIPGAVAWWKAEGNAFDSAGTNNGSLSGGVSFGGGRVAQAFVFDGSLGSRVDLGDVPILRSAAFGSLEGWIRRSSASAVSSQGTIGGLIGFGDKDQHFIGWAFYLDSTGRPIYSYNNQSFIPNVHITDTNYHHLALIPPTSSSGTVYVDGVAYSASYTFQHDFFNRGHSSTIGSTGDLPDYPFLGSVDELTIYDTVLTASQIQSIYTAGALGKCSSAPMLISGLMDQTVVIGDTVILSVQAGGSPALSYQWGLNGAPIAGATTSSLIFTNVQMAQAGQYSLVVTNLSGITNSSAYLAVNPAGCLPAPTNLISFWRAEGNALDTVSANNGLISGDATFGTGEVVQSFVFDGVNDGVLLGSPASLKLQDFSIEAWVKRADASLATGNGESGGTILGWDTGGYNFGVLNDGRLTFGKIGLATINTSPILTDTNFHHAALTKSGSNAVFYLDGVAYPGPAFDPGFIFTGAGAAIGSRGDLSHSFLGRVDELSFYNRALSAAEIQSIYSAGSAGKCARLLAPFVTISPPSQTANEMFTVVFSALAGGSPPFAYQWAFNSVAIAGATSSSLVLSNVVHAQAGDYTVQLSNQVGTAISAPATLTILPPATCLTRASGIVGWWKGDGNANDSVGSLNGALANGAGFAPGKFGQAFSFNGSGQFVSNIPGLNSVRASYTIEFWAMPSAGHASAVESPYPTPANGQRFAIQPFVDNTGLVGSGVSVGTNGVAVFEAGSFFRDVQYACLLAYDVPITGWTHVAVIYSNAQPTLYLNGVLVHTGVTSLHTSYPSTQLGGDGSCVGCYGGLLDEVAIYNRPLTASEINAIYNDTAAAAGKCPLPPSILTQPVSQGAVAGSTVSLSVTASGSAVIWYQWKFNGAPIPGGTNASLTLANVQTANAGNYDVLVSGPGGTTNSALAILSVNSVPCAAPPPNLAGFWRGEDNALDSASTNHGTIAGNVTYGAGEVSDAFVFDGVNDGVLLGSPAALKAQDFSIEAWVRRAHPTLSTANGESGGALLAWDTGGWHFGVLNSGALTLSRIGVSSVTTPPILSNTNFHHVSVTKSGSNVVFYLDAVAYTTTPYDPGFTFSGSAAIGSRGDLSHSFWGSIDEMSFYNRALSAVEIQSIYNAAYFGKCPSPPLVLHATLVNQNLVLSWPPWATDYQLQQTTNSSSPIWTAVSGTPTNNQLTIPVSIGPVYYRLFHP
jgi:hypothetical protein